MRVVWTSLIFLALMFLGIVLYEAIGTGMFTSGLVAGIVLLARHPSVRPWENSE